MEKVKLQKFFSFVDYENALEIQRKILKDVNSGKYKTGKIIMLEHNPCITLGKNAEKSHVTASETLLKKNNVKVFKTERGGQATYHGPGQAVVYPILKLRKVSRGVADYVNKLEEVMIKTAAMMGVKSFRRDKMTGVFCEQGKLGALGIKVSAGVTWHGLSFNLSPNLSFYDFIIPCGMKNTNVTSIKEVTGNAPFIKETYEILQNAFKEVFNFEIINCD